MKTNIPRAAVLVSFLALALTGCGALGVSDGGAEAEPSSRAAAPDTQFDEGRKGEFKRDYPVN